MYEDSGLYLTAYVVEALPPDLECREPDEERHARRVVSALMARGVLASEGPRAPFRLVFPRRTCISLDARPIPRTPVAEIG